MLESGQTVSDRGEDALACFYQCFCLGMPTDSFVKDVIFLTLQFPVCLWFVSALAMVILTNQVVCLRSICSCIFLHSLNKPYLHQTRHIPEKSICSATKSCRVRHVFLYFRYYVGQHKTFFYCHFVHIRPYRVNRDDIEYVYNVYFVNPNPPSENSLCVPYFTFPNRIIARPLKLRLFSNFVKS